VLNNVTPEGLIKTVDQNGTPESPHEKNKMYMPLNYLIAVYFNAKSAKYFQTNAFRLTYVYLSFGRLELQAIIDTTVHRRSHVKAKESESL